jgi:hypothetical protein
MDFRRLMFFNEGANSIINKKRFAYLINMKLIYLYILDISKKNG